MNIVAKEDNLTVVTISDTNAATLANYAERLRGGEFPRADGYIIRDTDNGRLIIQVESDEVHYKDREAGPAKEILDWPKAADIAPEGMGD